LSPRARATRTAVLLALVPLMAAIALGGCGGSIPYPDLFLVQRSGSVPGARLTLLVGEGGTVRCNGGKPRPLSDPLLLEARAIKEGLREPAKRSQRLPPRPGSVFSYSVRDEDGTASFADNSQGQPRAFNELALFVLNVAKGTCRLAL
jgi:hypothetical protein